MRLPEWPEWKEVIRHELEGLIQIGVWAEVPRETVPHGVKILPGKIILEIKTEDGKYKKCKARYVSRGDFATRGEHFWETSSHQVRAKSLLTTCQRLVQTGHAQGEGIRFQYWFV